MGDVGAVTLSAIMLFTGSSADLPIRHCLVHQDCFPGEFCREQQACTCQRDFVREPGGACLALRRAGEPCLVDQQCSKLDPRLLCHHGRCNCPQGAKRSDGTCLHRPNAPPPTREPARVSPPAYRVAAPALICLLIFVSFIILIYTTVYHFRLRRRRLAAQGNADREIAGLSEAPSHAPISTISDAPPPYSSLTPPTYEQATQLAPSTALKNAPPTLLPISRTLSDTAIMESAPLTSPDGSSAVSYGSGHTMTSPLSRSASDLPSRQ